MAYPNKALRQIMSQLRLAGGVAFRTLDAAVTCDEATETICFWDPGGSSRNVTLTPEESSDGLFHIFVNEADAAENLVIKNDAASTIVTINQNEWAIVACDGTTWRDIPLSALADYLATANTWTAAQALLDTSTLEDPADRTKKVRLDAGSVSAGQTRVLTMPDTDVTITAAGAALLDDASAAAQLVTLGVADVLVKATVAVSSPTGGATDATMTVDLFRLDGVTPIVSTRQVLIVWWATQYAPAAANNATTTVGTATKGTIVASGQSWALVETDAAGQFACTATNSADETLYFAVRTAPSGNEDVANGCLVVGSNSDAAAWSA